jgi:dephospho-CoA kinase
MIEFNREIIVGVLGQWASGKTEAARTLIRHLGGGDLDPDHQRRLEKKGAVITRVPNDYDDIERFRADIVAAFEEMFGGLVLAKTAAGKRERQ